MKEDPYFGKGKYISFSSLSQSWMQHPRLVSQRWSVFSCFEIPLMRTWIPRNCAPLFPHPSSHPSANWFFDSQGHYLSRDMSFHLSCSCSCSNQKQLCKKAIQILTVLCCSRKSVSRMQRPPWGLKCKDQSWKGKFSQCQRLFLLERIPAKDCSDTRVFITWANLLTSLFQKPKYHIWHDSMISWPTF